MGKKQQRIAALEHDLDTLAQYVDKLSARVKTLENTPAPVQGRSLGDRVRSELHDRFGWLGDLVGL